MTNHFFYFIIRVMGDFRTLPAGVYEQTYLVQKSRFIAFATRVDNSEQAQAFLKSVALPDATHHCYAYLTADGQKSSDNGEPSGTAGIPILQAIKQSNLSNVAVAVERYFGGIKLGTGGLARAYGQATSQVLESVAPVLMRECVILEFTANYEQKTLIDKLVAEYGKELNLRYTELVHWQVAIPVVNQDLFVEKLTEIGHGHLKVNYQTQQIWVEFHQ